MSASLEMLTTKQFRRLSAVVFFLKKQCSCLIIKTIDFVFILFLSSIVKQEK